MNRKEAEEFTAKTKHLFVWVKAKVIKTHTADGLDFFYEEAVGNIYNVNMSSICKMKFGRRDKPELVVEREVIWAEPAGWMPLELLEILEN